MKSAALFRASMLTVLCAVGLIGCGRQSGTTSDYPYTNYAKVKTKLESFEKGEITLEDVTSTGPGVADAEWVHSLVQYYLMHSNQITAKMKLPISRCFGVMGDYPEAITLAREYLNLYSNDWRGWRIIGAASFKAEEFNAAVDAYTSAVNLGDDVSCDVLALAALKANRLDALPRVVPRLVFVKDSQQTPHEKRLEIAMLLVIYSMKADQKEVFVQALGGLNVDDVTSRPDLNDLVRKGCAKFKPEEAEELCAKLVP